LKRNELVIYDRYILSGLAYADMDGVDLVKGYEGLTLPHCTLYLNINPVKARERAGFGEGFRETPKEHDRAELAFLDVIDNIDSKYSSINHTIHWIEADKSAENVLGQALKALSGIKTI